ncbi:hypothetical protein JOF29_000069 [Kribbella aluminosa]|uniref:Attachment p12 family protein n=1 Tax=Kribbella aluminosa TaxID=416017 RepID=A0ABS4UBK1_9ACTN|nr:hypothetical protein [Kribbella aluminosa]MBP2348986.1 hypothetical protein [Kribbella aluminosa]
MPGWFPLAAAVAGIGLMYFVCIRPMRRGTCGPAGCAAKDTTTAAAQGGDAARDAELDRLRAEIAQVRDELEVPRQSKT